jgi:hypothetical protein
VPTLPRIGPVVSVRALLACLAVMLGAVGVARADAPWSAPQAITSGVAANPSLAVDPAGDAYAVWTGIAPGRRPHPVLRVATRPAGAAWNPAQVLSLDGIFPSVSADADGDAIAAWQTTAAPRRIQFARYDPIMGWSAAGSLSPGPATAVSVGMNPAGEAVAAWVRLRGSGAHPQPAGIQIAVAAPGSTFAPAVTIAGADRAAAPQVAIDASGDAAVAWQAAAKGHCLVKATFVYATAVIVNPRTVSAANAACTASQQVGIDAAGDATVVWLARHSRQRYDVQAMTRARNGRWSARLTLARGSTTPPRLAEDVAGDRTVVFGRRGAGHSVIEAAIGLVGQPWVVSAIPGARGEAPQVSADAAGDVVAVWIQGGTLAAAIHPFGADWRPIGAVVHGRELTGVPLPVLDAAGDALVGWRERGGLESAALIGPFG